MTAVRLLFSFGLAALMQLLGFIVPAEVLPQRQATDFFYTELNAARLGSDPYIACGGAVVWNNSNVVLTSADVFCENSSQGAQPVSGYLGRHGSLSFDLGLSGRHEVSVKVRYVTRYVTDMDEGELSGRFIHDFSDSSLLLGVQDDEKGDPSLVQLS